MFCSKCGKEYLDSDLPKFCSNCGCDLGAPKECIPEASQRKVELWSPNIAIAWSGVFSPVFGAWIHAKNWSCLGEEQKEKQSMYWFYVGIFILILVASLSVIMAKTYLQSVPKIIYVSYFLVWALFAGNSQVKYVKEKLSKDYQKKNWAKPIGIALIGAILSIAITVGLVMSFNPVMQHQSALSDMSGVWRGDSDGAMVTFHLDGSSKFIEINDQRFPVVVKQFDIENNILTVSVNNDPLAIWSIRQNFDKNGKFTLDMTLSDGTQDSLSFVRNLTAEDTKISAVKISSYVYVGEVGNRGQDTYAIGANNDSLEIDSSKVSKDINDCLSFAMSEHYKVEVVAKLTAGGVPIMDTLTCSVLN